MTANSRRARSGSGLAATSRILVRPPAICPVCGLRHWPSPSKSVNPLGKFGAMVCAANSAHSASVRGWRPLILRPKNNSATSMCCSAGSRHEDGGAGNSAQPASSQARAGTVQFRRTGQWLFRSERRRPDGLPAKALEELGNLAIVHRRKRALQAPRLLEHPARSTRRVEEQRPPGFGSRVLPGMRDAARYKGTGAGAADGDPIVDLEGEFSAQNIDQLVTVVVEVKRGIRARRRGLLE